MHLQMPRMKLDSMQLYLQSDLSILESHFQIALQALQCRAFAGLHVCQPVFYGLSAAQKAALRSMTHLLPDMHSID